MTIKAQKKKALRFNEYYNTQYVQDKLYQLGKCNYKFTDLISLITAEQNVMLAYRTIKTNKGSKTAGTNGTVISAIAETNPEQLVEYVKSRLRNYIPHSVKRVEIPKPNGKTRPLGIPTIEDRLIQQCIRQILEPILEAKFYEHSYGFRPDRSTSHAIARFYHLAYSGFHYVVDIDIKGFFDNVNHGKLLKQLWTLGIRDKTFISIISRMLKAPIKGVGVPQKGTPQGGILSPLLANVVLNELDWWIASQWDNFPTDYPYKYQRSKLLALKESSLKEIKIVRYADDFKIMCKDYKTAQKIFTATQMWLKQRLQLDISPEKSRITNIRKRYSEFLGLKLKVRKGKANRYTNRSHMRDKAKENAIKKLKEQIKVIQKNPTREAVNKYNSIVIGLQNYYSIATMVNEDFIKIAYIVNKSLLCRTKKIRAITGSITKTYLKFYKDYEYKKVFIAKTILFPIAGIKFREPKMISKNCTRYTENGRNAIHQRLKMDMRIIHYLMEQSSTLKGTTEYNDNRISVYVAQNGLCKVTGTILKIGNMDLHHITPKFMGGNDEYKNLIYITNDVHILVHAVENTVLEKYLAIVNPDKEQLKKINQYRVLVGNNELDYNACY